MVLEVSEANLLFQLRARMTDVKVNFRNKYSDTRCPICKVEGNEDSQKHIFECEELVKNNNIVSNNDILYAHIFDSDVEKQKAALRMFKYLWSEGQATLKTREEEQQQPGDPVPASQ